MSNAASPYAPPAARVDDVPAGPNPQAEAIRTAHISHEASIKSVGILYYLGSGLTVVAGVASMLGAKADPLMALVLVAVGAGGLFAGYGVRALRQWGRVVGCATPHVKYRTSIIVWIFLALLVALVVIAVGLPMFRK